MVNPFNWLSRKKPEATAPEPTTVDALIPGNSFFNSDFDGEKFLGGFGTTKIYNTDYQTLRERSEMIFTDNLFASGLIKRIVTHEVNTGLSLEASPLRTVLGLTDEYIEKWAEKVEDLHKIWEWNKDLCDYQRMRTYGEILSDIRTESLVCGDILVVQRTNSLGLPCIQTISGSLIGTPNDRLLDPMVSHGVEVNAAGEHIGYFVLQGDGTYKRLAARSAKGRRKAWLVYGSNKRMDATRGVPLLSIVLQSLKEIDRYRDAALRKAVVNSILAMFIKKSLPNTVGTTPISGGAVKRTLAEATSSDGTTREFQLAGQIPGMVFENLAPGEEPVGFDSKGTDLNYPEFQNAIIDAIAWSMGMPPSKLKLAYSSNYSASQAELNDFKTLVSLDRNLLASSVCQPFYEEELAAYVAAGKIDAPGYLEAYLNPRLYDIYGAWVYAEWSGVVQPATDILKTTKAYIEQISNGLVTRKIAIRELNGRSSRDIFRGLKKENEELGVKDDRNQSGADEQLPANQ